MSEQNRHKLQNLLAAWAPGVIATTPWLKSFGISRGLVQAYKARGWISQFDNGAYYKSQDTVDWSGALYALQSQLELPVHVGGKSALELLGHAHFLPMGKSSIDLLKAPNTKIPAWFVRHQWNEQVRVVQSGILPNDLGLENVSMGNFPIRISTRERAALELIHLAPRLYDFDEVRIIMESLGTLRPDVLTELLSLCTSEKTKRLLLYFGEIQGHSWRKSIREEKIQTSKHLLKIVPKKGKYNAKYNIYIPYEYVIQNDQDVKF